MRNTPILIAAAFSLGIGGAAFAAESTDAPGAKQDITIVQATPENGTEAGPAKSDEPRTGAGSQQMGGANSGDQGGTGVKGSAQEEGANSKDPAPRD